MDDFDVENNRNDELSNERRKSKVSNISTGSNDIVLFSLKTRKSVIVSIVTIFSFLIMTTITAIIVVCLNIYKEEIRPCHRIFKVTVNDANGYNSRPRSAIVTDLNNDTYRDIIVANSGTDTVGIFLGSSNGTFQEHSSYSTGFKSTPYAVAVGDFNSDKHVDIVSANYGTNCIGIMISNGNGTFGSMSFYSLGSTRPTAITTADLNNDLNLDLVVASYNTSSILILFGYGNASFTIEKKYSSGYDSLPHEIRIADLNGDNYMDIIIANHGTCNVATMLGYGNGSFTSQSIYSTGTGSNPTDVAIGDMNGDNRLDLIVAIPGSYSIGILFGQGDGRFAKIKIYPISSELRPSYIAVDDLNNDKILDVAITYSDSGTIEVYVGQMNGSFKSHETYFTKYESALSSIIISNFDDDKLLDFVTIDTGTNAIEVFHRYNMKVFANITKYQTTYFSSPICVTVDDFNNDEQMDIAVGHFGDNFVRIFLGYGNGTFFQKTVLSTGTGSIATWIVTEDLNDDSLVDIVVANANIDSLTIFLAYGNTTFAEKKTLSTGNASYPIMVIVSDFNRDALLDIAVANFFAGNFGIFLGYGNGSFAEQKTFSTGFLSRPTSLAVGHFNNDSQVDIVVTNSKASNVAIFLGNGNGDFILYATFSNGNNSFPNSVAVADFNYDNLSDIAYVDYVGDCVVIMFGHGNGHFEQVAIYSMGDASQPTTLIVDDFNGDSLLDIAATNSGINNIGILFGNSDGSFGTVATYSIGQGSHPTTLAADYFNNDTWIDIAVANFEDDTIGVLLGYENKDLAIQTTYSTGSGPHPYSISITDFNNDNIMDLMIVNKAHNSVSIRLGYGNGTFVPETVHSAEIDSFPQYAIAGDFDNDHQIDIVILNTRKDSITVALGYNNGIFRTQHVHSTGYGSLPCFAAVGDFNRDMRLDLAILNEGTDSVGIFLSFDYAVFRIHHSLSFGLFSSPTSIAVGDFNNDSLLDIAVLTRDINSISILLGYENTTFRQQHDVFTGNDSSPQTVTVADFNKDNILDIAVTNYITNNIGICLGYGNGSFSDQITFSTGRNSRPISIDTGDLNKDGFLDIVVANFIANTVGILFGYGNGTFEGQKTLSTGTRSRPSWIAIGDSNNDSLLDIFVANMGTNNVGLFVANGSGSFEGQVTISIEANSSPISITLDDLNDDNKIDIVVANYALDSVSILLGYGNGSFTLKTTYSTGDGSFPMMVVLKDTNDDNILDIVVPSHGSDYIGIFFGYGDGKFTEQMIYLTTAGSQPVAIAIGDFNKDNRTDFVVANFLDSTITIFLREGSRPFLAMSSYSTGNYSNSKSMAVADFNNDGHQDIVMANYGNDNIGLLMGYGDGTFKELTTYSKRNGSKPYSIGFGHFNNDSLLDIVVTYLVTNDVSILIGYGNGTFSVKSSYSIGESLGPSSIVVSDFNNDHFLDVSIVHANSKNMILLYGNGDGAFDNMQSYAVGYGSILYSVAAGNLNNDSWIDIAVANYGTDHIDILLQGCDNM